LQIFALIYFQFLLLLLVFRARVFGDEQARTDTSVQEKSRRLPTRKEWRRKKGEKLNSDIFKNKNIFYTNEISQIGSFL
jgi:hypothetical protein